MSRPFDRRSSEIVLATSIFALRKDVAAHPGTGETAPYFVLEHPDWVVVVPETTDGRLVLVRQWRHGSRAVELEVPAGLIDPGEGPLDAAPRELLEETGYQAERWLELGSMLPNPAYQDNRCHGLLAEGCRRVAEPSPDADEDIAVELVAASDVQDLVRGGQLRNSTVLCAVLWWLDHRARIRWP